MAKAKPKSGVRGVYYRDDGRLRWEVKIRWTDREGVKQSLGTQRFPIDLNAARGTPAHIDRAKSDAEAFAAQEWQAIDTFGTARAQRADAWTLRALLERYLDDLEAGLVPHKSLKTERASIRMLLGLGKGNNSAGFPDITEKWVGDLKYGDFIGNAPKSVQSRLLDRDGNRASNGSLKRVLTVVRGVFVRAQNEWKIELKNPLQSIKGLSSDDARERTIDPDEWERITDELKRHEQGTQDAIAFARYTAARRLEVVKLDWSDINLDKKTAALKETKSKSGKVVSRVIPLPAHAFSIIARRAKEFGVSADGKPKRLGGAVFTNDKGQRIRPDSLTQAWSRAASRAGVEGARVHDLRHTRITELGRFLTAAEAARVSGHTDLATFFRYFNPDAVETGKKIDAMEQGKEAMTERVREVAQALTTLSSEDFASAIATAIEIKSRSVAGR